MKIVNTVVAEKPTSYGSGFETDSLGTAVSNDFPLQPLLMYEYGAVVES
jgi:hypothetical protein